MWFKRRRKGTVHTGINFVENQFKIFDEWTPIRILPDRYEGQSEFDYFCRNWPYLRIWGSNGPDGSLDVTLGDVKYRLILDPDVTP